MGKCRNISVLINVDEVSPVTLFRIALKIKLSILLISQKLLILDRTVKDSLTYYLRFYQNSRRNIGHSILETKSNFYILIKT